MKDYKKEFKKLNLAIKDLPAYVNSESFANNFKRCSLYEYKDVSYSSTVFPLNTKVLRENKNA